MSKYYVVGLIGLGVCVALIVIQQIAKKTPVLVINEDWSRSHAKGFGSKMSPITDEDAKIECDYWMHEFEVAIASQPHSFRIITKEEGRALRRTTWKLSFNYVAMPPPAKDLDQLDILTVIWELRGPGEASFHGLDNAREIAKRVTAIIENWRD